MPVHLFPSPRLPTEPCYPAFDPLTPSSPDQAAHTTTVHACVCSAPKYPAVKGTCSHGTARCLENANRIRTRHGHRGGWESGMVRRQTRTSPSLQSGRLIQCKHRSQATASFHMLV